MIQPIIYPVTSLWLLDIQYRISPAPGEGTVSLLWYG